MININLVCNVIEQLAGCRRIKSEKWYSVYLEILTYCLVFKPKQNILNRLKNGSYVAGAGGAYL